ncbi:enoyl-CoA hydratase/isomerase family protein [Microbulbifer agarilyticus]|uniref:enoyl-CoA hydratase/isomerase family protein n=1 Tax=Microbulbifer agarilyticus TaxID=260552 RepID=UPI001CD3DDB8|nr:enoyl-CoA hydratase/isomerase family protein [Microbulbifer agarilyticus]MCA0900835.1 enoyl-CoA hydratase/isomerase family protein [Microbulbifer agarilyticus]
MTSEVTAQQSEGNATGTPRVEMRLDDGLARITLVNPDQRNAMTVAMWQQLASVLDQVEAHDQVRAVLISGAGSRAFCAGANIAELSQAMSDPAVMRQQNALIQEVQLKLQCLSRPTIALVRGACYGGGCGLALACDLRIADTAATFAITPAKLGILYSIEDTRRLVRAVGDGNAREMLLTGLPVDATRALQIGLVQHVAEGDALEDKARELARALIENSQYSVRWTKATLGFLAGGSGDEPEKGKEGADALKRAFDAAFSGKDFAEGCAAFLARRKADFRWPQD